MSRFNIINKAEKLVDYILIITEKSPKKLRLDIIPAIRNKALQIIENIVIANRIPIDEKSISGRIYYQSLALTDIRVLETFLEIATKRNYLTNKQLDYSTQLTQELYDMINNWQISDSDRLNNQKLGV